ncbi:hypothetical protein Bbelb_112430 [Branchiostoma belcheri]|nr:hypothetical protein Bbelb_112430 [Branchiostoma belcheri]
MVGKSCKVPFPTAQRRATVSIEPGTYWFRAQRSNRCATDATDRRNGRAFGSEPKGPGFKPCRGTNLVSLGNALYTTFLDGGLLANPISLRSTQALYSHTTLAQFTVDRDGADVSPILGCPVDIPAPMMPGLVIGCVVCSGGPFRSYRRDSEGSNYGTPNSIICGVTLTMTTSSLR